MHIHFLYINLTDSSFQKIDNTIQSAGIKKKLQNIEKDMANCQYYNWRLCGNVIVDVR